MTTDLATTGASAADAGAERTLELEIGGMTCASCALRIEKKLNNLDGVTAGVIASIVVLHLIDWDNLPLGATLSLGAETPTQMASK